MLIFVKLDELHESKASFLVWLSGSSQRFTQYQAEGTGCFQLSSGIPSRDRMNMSGTTLRTLTGTYSASMLKQMHTDFS